MAKKDDLPAMPFYTGDWFKAGDVRSLTVEQRGIWIDMLFYMWESNERGYLVDASGQPYTISELSRMIGLSEDLLKQNLKQMESKKIFSLRESDGAIFCRRIVRDQRIREIRKEVGKIGGIRNKEKNLLKQNDKQKDKQITENEIEDENKSLKEGIIRETKLEPLDERKSQYGGPTFGAVKEFFTQNNRLVDEAVIFWNEYEQKKWYVSNREGEPTRKLKTTRDWMLKAEQWIKKARINEIDKSKNKTDFQQKIENSTYRPAYPTAKNTMCECGCGKSGIMRMDKYLVASRACCEKLKKEEAAGFKILGNVIKSLNRNKTEEESL